MSFVSDKGFLDRLRGAGESNCGRVADRVSATDHADRVRRRVRILPSAVRTLSAAAANADPELQALTDLCQAILSSNEFLYVDSSRSKTSTTRERVVYATIKHTTRSRVVLVLKTLRGIHHDDQTFRFDRRGVKCSRRARSDRRCRAGLVAEPREAAGRPPTVKLKPQSFDLMPKRPPGEAKARAMISLFMHGGPAHMDLLDPKPELTKFSGTDYTGEVVYSFVNRASKSCSARRGRSRSTEIAAPKFRNCCRTRPASSMTCA